MSFEFRGLGINKVGVIGSGQIGPDIALYFSKAFYAYGVQVVVVDVVEEALRKGHAKVEKKIKKGEETGAFSASMAKAMLDGITFTNDYGQLKGTDFVVEAATENLELKQKIFGQLEQICSPTAIFASNSSHLEPEVIFEKIADKKRTMVIHYFFPAERNPLVEIVPGADTDPKLTHTMMSLYEHIGKVPIHVKSRYGYAVDPIFEGLFLASALCVEEGLGTVKEVDSCAREAVGLNIGSFTAMNLTGGNPLTDHGLETEGKHLNSWFYSPKLMKDAIASGKPWEVAARGEKVDLTPEKKQPIIDSLRGAYFGLVGQIIDSEITNVSDLEMALEIALDMKPPFSFMNRLGIEKALSLVEDYAKRHPKFPVPQCLKRQADKREPWKINYVHRHDVGDVAWIRIRRPKVLNALNQDVFDQLKEHFEDVKSDSKIKAAVLSGFGVKAFVSGADVNFLAKIETPEQGEATTNESKQAGIVIENLGKPVVCALNGLAFGGGLELAMCCSALLVKKGLKVAAGQPEANLGIIPGAGGTQRLSRWVGMEKAAKMIRTTKPISSEEGVRIGLFRAEVEAHELIDTAIQLARDAASRKIELASISRAPMQVPAELPELDIGHLSKAIDQIICRALLEGCQKPLPEGLAFESRMFGECVKTQDMKIGIANFLKNGPRAKAGFQHS